MLLDEAERRDFWAEVSAGFVLSRIGVAPGQVVDAVLTTLRDRLLASPGG